MRDEIIKQARILLVDDKEANVRLLERLLKQEGYTNTVPITDSRTVLAQYNECQPDLILLDLLMPYLDGFGVMEQLRRRTSGTYVPILVLTADINADTKRRALTLGAKDFLTKPFDPVEVLLRIWNLLETRFLNLELQQQNYMLDVRVRERTQELQDAQIEIIERLACAAEYRDDITGLHTYRVSQIAVQLAEALHIAPDKRELLQLAASLHDLGKIGIPDAILLKPAKLTPEEFEQIKAHTTIGGRILSGSHFKLLQLAEEIALSHHERWDGLGYPSGLKGEAIPLVGRIVAVADVFDALTHKRPYKEAWPVADALAEIERESGDQFDPSVVAALLQLHKHSHRAIIPVS